MAKSMKISSESGEKASAKSGGNEISVISEMALSGVSNGEIMAMAIMAAMKYQYRHEK